MKVLLASLNLRAGGAEKVCLLLAHELGVSGDEVQVTSIRGPVEYSALATRLKRPITVLFPDGAPYFWTHLPAFAREFRRHCIAQQPDAIVVFGVQMSIIARLAVSGPLFVSAQNANDLHWRGARPGYIVLRYLEKWAMAREGTSVVACSTDAADAYARHFSIRRERIGVVVNSTNVEEFECHRTRPLGTTPAILCVGTPYYQKNFQMAVRALARLRQLGIDASLTIVGDGPQRSDLERLGERLGISANLRLLGHRSDVGLIMAESDLFWMTSRWEGLPLVLAEAMVSGLPVIATNVPGIRNVVRHEENGLLVPSDDDSALAAATFGLVRTPDIARGMATQANSMARTDFHPRRMAEAYRAILSAAGALQW